MHCVRAVEAGFASGPHGLPLMGTGDWNDAMNRVGHKGRGESLFVAFLGIVCIREFLPILEAFGEETRVRAWREKMGQWIDAVEKHGWDGAWYRRAFADDGSILGSAAASACKIDALTQAWAVFALGATDRTRQALQSALTRLWDREHHLFRLLDPPFTAMGEAGYISGYQAGVRENGGQYTHAAAWTVLALCRVGEVETAYTLYSDLLPCSLTDDAQKVMQYQGEPYVCAADVYTAPGMVGQAGWTWYTGSAGWLLRAAVEGLIGAVKTADAVEFRHAPPEALGNVTLIHRGKSYTSS